MKKTIFLTIALLAGAIGLSPTSQAANPNVMNIKTSITDDAIVFPETFEQDTQKLLEGLRKHYGVVGDGCLDVHHVRVGGLGCRG